jgi:hypothetical protein
MDTSRELIPPPQNPYVGPRPYELAEKDRFYGRDRESRDLLSLVLSERLVLFYAQSGAGKTSLINTRLKPGLEEAGFEVLQVGRVSGELPPDCTAANIFVTNLMLKLDEGNDDPKRFAGLGLTEFLLNLTKEGKAFYYRQPVHPGSEETNDRTTPAVDLTIESSAETLLLPRALIIDQFEELFTTHPEAWKQRGDFLRQLMEAMDADPYLWVVLAMREDHIAELDPYASFLRNGLRVRYYMQRMAEKSAFEAVTTPVAKLRPFEEETARLLVDNLARISAGKDEKGQPSFVEGEFIEPVQLQVVCYQLWENLKNQPGERITLDNLQRLARGQDLAQFVNQALADYYEDTLSKTLREPGSRVSEGKLREWFSTQLITEAGTRGFVYMGEHRTGGIPNAMVLYLEGKLVRGDSRAAGRWYELVHDRFIDPILQANRRWAQARQRKILRIGVGIFSIILFLACISFFFSAYLFPTSRQQGKTVTQVYLTLEGSQQTATSIASDLFNAVARATQANDALNVVQDSKDNLYATQVEAENTLAAAKAIATQAALEYQLLILQSPKDSPVPIPTATAPEVGERTPTPTPRSNEPTPSPTPEILATQQAATASALQAQLQGLNATQTAMANPIRELIIGQSVNGQSIYVDQLGNGTRNVVLVGGMHSGSAPSTVDLARQVLDYFTENMGEIPDNVKLHIISNASPDNPRLPNTLEGRTNANGVDLNRNWDCDWKRQATWAGKKVSGGTAPFSEPETQALRDYFQRTQPVAVIFLEAMAEGGQVSPGGCGIRSLFSEALAKIYGGTAGYNVGEFVAYAVNGDASNWLDAQGIPAISVLLPDRVDVTESDLKNNLAAILAVFKNYGQNQSGR